jgi:hypothetical protein
MHDRDDEHDGKRPMKSAAEALIDHPGHPVLQFMAEREMHLLKQQAAQGNEHAKAHLAKLEKVRQDLDFELRLDAMGDQIKALKDELEELENRPRENLYDKEMIAYAELHIERGQRSKERWQKIWRAVRMLGYLAFIILAIAFFIARPKVLIWFGGMAVLLLGLAAVQRMLRKHAASEMWEWIISVPLFALYLWWQWSR